MERREFIRSAAMVTSGILLSGGVNAMTDESSKLNIAIIGCGDRGKGLLHVLNKMPEKFRVTGLCDSLGFRLDEAKKIAGNSVKISSPDYRKVLGNRNIQAVIIATPLNMHFPIAKYALQAGKHVYLEKTMTYTISEALELVELVKMYPGQILQVGHQYRYTPLYFQVKDMITQGYLGKVTQIDCRWDRNGSWRRHVPHPSLEREINWRMYKEYSGGLVAELLSHQIDFINWAFDSHPDRILGSGGIDFYKDGRETHDNVQVIMRYDKEGMICNFGATCANAHDGYLFKLKGTKGSISLQMKDGVFYPEKQTLSERGTIDGVTGATKLQSAPDGGIKIPNKSDKDGSWHALMDFHQCINVKGIPSSNVFTGARTAIAVHLANQAIERNEITNWDPKYNRT